MRLRQMFMDEQADQERKLHGHNYDLTMTLKQRALTLTLLVVGGGIRTSKNQLKNYLLGTNSQ